jgi:hypothetical protein
MAKSDPLSFNFGYNVAAKKAKSGGARKGTRKLSEAQKYTAQFYMKPRGRR